MVSRRKLGGSRGKAVGFQHERDDIPVGGFVEGTGRAVRHVGADELQQIADGFLRETLPEWVAHQRRLAFCRERMTARAALAEGRYATGSLSLRVHTVPDGPSSQEILAVTDVNTSDASSRWPRTATWVEQTCRAFRDRVSLQQPCQAAIVLEARVRIELTNKGFADLCLTTWLPRRIQCGLGVHRRTSLRTIPRRARRSQLRRIPARAGGHDFCTGADTLQGLLTCVAPTRTPVARARSAFPVLFSALSLEMSRSTGAKRVNTVRIVHPLPL